MRRLAGRCDSVAPPGASDGRGEPHLDDRVAEELAHILREAGFDRTFDHDPQERVVRVSGERAQLVDRAAQRAESTSPGDRNRTHDRGRLPVRRHEQHAVRPFDLAEVDLQRRARVPDRRGAGDLLRAVEVPERDVVRVRGERDRADRVVHVRLRRALAATQRRAHHHAVRGDDVHGVIGERRAQRRDHLAHALVVGRDVLARVLAHELLGADDPALREERHERNSHRVARTAHDLDDAAIRRTPRRAHHHDAQRGEQRTHRLEPRRVVVVARDDDDVRARVAQVEQRLQHERLGVGGRRRGLVEVAGDQHDVDVLGVGDADDVGQHGPVLREPRLALDRLADVPVGGVQQLHGASRL